MACIAAMSSPVQRSMAEEPCRLLQLPDEIKLEIVKHVHLRRDLYNFSLACKSLEDMTLSRLYESINVEIPGSNTPYWNQDALPAFRPYVLRNMRELIIKNGMSDIKNPVYHKRRRSDANTTEGYVGEILKSVPKDRLKGFSFMHKTPVSMHLLDGLARQHGHSLKHLQCSELELLNNSEATVPSKLHTLECRVVLSGEAVAKLITANKDTLTTLTLGQDKYLLQQYRERRIGFLNNIPQPSDASYIDINPSGLPNLQSLSLSGLDLAPLLPQTIESALALTKLETLSLDSCPATVEFLDTLTSTFAHIKTLPNPPQPALKSFSIRHEMPTAPLQQSLIHFLTSFTGLTSLSILLENATFTHRPSTFLQPHSSTLHSFTLESRIQPREHSHIDTSRPCGSTANNTSEAQLWQETLSDIQTHAPHLVELGTAFPWHLTHETQTQCTNALRELKNLKTLHIRNYPSSAPVDGTPTTIQTHADHILSQLASPQTNNLETLAIGPTLYSTRWRQESSFSSSPTARATNVVTTQNNRLAPPSQQRTGAKKASAGSAPEHLRTHYFAVKTASVCEPVSERYVEEVRGQRNGLGGVFQGVWLK